MFVTLTLFTNEDGAVIIYECLQRNCTDHRPCSLGQLQADVSSANSSK